MQRIDENTYIDDTLVTCAEYQLFIDEMREQGKYYQPDHWTSYQFPKGQARDPILGVRQSDAWEFCTWLTIKEYSGWNYRLPNEEEIKSFLLKIDKNNSLGYWINGAYKFVWIDHEPKNARGLFVDNVINQAVEILLFNNDFSLETDLSFAYDHTHIRALDVAYIFEVVYLLYSDLYFTGASDHARNFVVNLNFDRSNSHKNFDRALKTSLNLAFHFNSSVDRDPEAPSELITFMSSRNRKPKSLLEKYLNRDRNLALEMYIDILTLQERIAGRSPAFEGIRLVKERIK